MALFLFTKAIAEGRPIQVFNHGKMQRDFTYIDDIIEGVVRIMARLPEARGTPQGPRPCRRLTSSRIGRVRIVCSP